MKLYKRKSPKEFIAYGFCGKENFLYHDLMNAIGNYTLGVDALSSTEWMSLEQIREAHLLYDFDMYSSAKGSELETKKVIVSNYLNIPYSEVETFSNNKINKLYDNMYPIKELKTIYDKLSYIGAVIVSEKDK